MQNAVYNQTQPTDAEKLRSTLIEQEQSNLVQHQAGRLLQLEKFAKQRADREMLEHSCSQPSLRSTARNLPPEFAIKESSITPETTIRTTYRNPSKNYQLAPVLS
jgi:hypothetical protein